MKGRMLPLFRWFLLLCVVLNLGDAPYIDEILADMDGQQTLVTAAASAAEHADATSPHNDAGKATRSPYENLLSNVPMPAEDVAPTVFAKPAEAVPPSAAYFVPVPPGSRIERPPRTGLRTA